MFRYRIDPSHPISEIRLPFHYKPTNEFIKSLTEVFACGFGTMNTIAQTTSLMADAGRLSITESR